MFAHQLNHTPTRTVGRNHRLITSRSAWQALVCRAPVPPPQTTMVFSAPSNVSFKRSRRDARPVSFRSGRDYFSLRSLLALPPRIFAFSARLSFSAITTSTGRSYPMEKQ